MVSLIWSDTILAEAGATRDRVAAELVEAQINGVVTVTGPAGMPGVLTRGDVDLHLRVDPGHFAEVVSRLGRLYEPTSQNSWAATLAVFEVPADRPTGLAVTPVGSPHDRRFSRSWERLRTEPDLLHDYNALKVRHVDTDSYEEHKSAFFDRIMA